MAGLMAWPAFGDEIVLNTGERFISDRIWDEGQKIRFNMHGLLVSVDKNDVMAVIRSNGQNGLAAPPLTDTEPSAPDTHSAPTPPAMPTEHPEPSDITRQPEQPPPVAETTPPNPTSSSPKVTGIGLDGIWWQMKPSQIPGIVKGQTDPAYGGIDQYWRPDSRLKLGDVLLDGLVFGFWRNRLYTIMIWVDGRPAYDRLHQAVVHRYGTGKKSAKEKDRYIWLEKTTDRMLEFDDKSNTGIFWMRSRELDANVKQRYPQ